MDEKKRKNNPSPFRQASFISKLFIWYLILNFLRLNIHFFQSLYFSWISPLLKLGNKRPLTEDDMYNPLPSEESEFLTKELEW
jgi:hypothetical protein